MGGMFLVANGLGGILAGPVAIAFQSGLSAPWPSQVDLGSICHFGHPHDAHQPSYTRWFDWLDIDCTGLDQSDGQPDCFYVFHDEFFGPDDRHRRRHDSRTSLGEESSKSSNTWSNSFMFGAEQLVLDDASCFERSPDFSSLAAHPCADRVAQRWKQSHTSNFLYLAVNLSILSAGQLSQKTDVPVRLAISGVLRR